jgi:nucleotide-binding universal stress UspA family protein
VYRRVVIGYDGSAGARDALVLGGELARLGGEPPVVARILPQHPYLRESDRRVKEEAAALAAEAERAAAPAGGSARVLAAASPARGLHELAEETEADLVVVGASRHTGLSSIMGGVPGRLLHGSPCAVAVAPAGLRERGAELRVVAVGYDGGPESREALAVAAELGRRADAALRVFLADDPSAWPGADHGYGAYRRTVGEEREAALEEVVRALPEECRAAAQVLHDDATQALLGEAAKGVDLLVLGSRGYGPVRRVLLGSVAAAVVAAAPCPVLVVPRGAAVPD